MISIRVKDFSSLRRCSAVTLYIWISNNSFFFYCKVYSYGNGIYAIIFYVGCMASEPQRQKKKKRFQNICSIFCWMLTAGSDVFHFWPCEILSCVCNALYIKYTNCFEGFSCLHKNTFPENKCCSGQFHPCHFFFLLYHGMRNARYILLRFKYVIKIWYKYPHHNADLFLVNASCFIVLRNLFKLSNQLLFPIRFTEYCFYYCYFLIVI